ncbi:S8 family serine peptidase [Pimelobacter simplex]|uniref:S8 family serine peptidase n=1 Tax=Nocardioides simplex TaxID=2045 RepID=UPI0037FF9282
MRHLARRRTAAGVALAALALALPLPVAAAAPAAPAVAPTGPDCPSVTADFVDQRTVGGTNEANERLQVPRAQELARELSGKPAGTGVTVVVVDTPFDDPDRAPGAASGHGLVAAGIIGGRDQTDPVRVDVGIAPDARVVSAPFYTTPESERTDGGVVPMASGLAARLGTVAADVRSGTYGSRVIVLVPTQVPRSAALEKQVARLIGAGALVVAASGDRPAEGEFPEQLFEDKPGEDAADVVWPAAAPGVLAVGVSTPGTGTILRSSRIDLAAPGADAVSRGRNGGWCTLPAPSTHWAAAQVAAVAALVWSAYPREDATALATRLEQTASGSGGPASAVTGYGIVQPVEALQRRVDAASPPPADPMTPAPPPREQADLLAGTRKDAVWWGLGGGAALVVLIVLRPLLSRRR